MTCGQAWWLILGICALRLTYSKCTHTAVNTHTHTHHEHTPGAVGSHLCCSTQGVVVGSMPCSRAPQSWYWGWRGRCTFPHLQFLPAPRLELTTFRLRVWLSNPGVSNSSICLLLLFLLLFVYNNIVFIIIIICLSIICLVFVKLKSIIYCSKVLTKCM